MLFLKDAINTKSEEKCSSWDELYYILQIQIEEKNDVSDWMYDDKTWHYIIFLLTAVKSTQGDG